MKAALVLILLTDAYPLYRAWRSNRHSTLTHALLWAVAAWLAWLTAFVSAVGKPANPNPLLPYLALCLTGCAGVAVLGARRPGIGAWNFVVAGLLAVLLRPLLEGWGTLRLGPAHLVFLAATLAVVLLNYLVTRLALAGLAFGFGCGGELLRLAGAALPSALEEMGWVALALAPWIALASGRRRLPGNPVNALWLSFRDRFGGMWGLRVREQFNRAAANAGYAVSLPWQGFPPHALEEPQKQAVLLDLLRGVLKRFGLEEETERGSASGAGT
jgi:hypothetical protein